MVIDYDFRARKLLRALRQRLSLVSWSAMNWVDVHAKHLIYGDICEDVVYVTGLLKVGWGMLKLKSEHEISMEILLEDRDGVVDSLARSCASDFAQALLDYRPGDEYGS